MNYRGNGAKTNFKMSTWGRKKRSVLFWCENVALGHEIRYFFEHGKRSREAQNGSQNVDLVSKETLGCENVALGHESHYFFEHGKRSREAQNNAK